MCKSRHTKRANSQPGGGLGWVILVKAQRIGSLCGVAHKDVEGGRPGERTGKSMATSHGTLFNNWSHLIWRLEVSEGYYTGVP
jgi:hypothetical protein